MIRAVLALTLRALPRVTSIPASCRNEFPIPPVSFIFACPVRLLFAGSRWRMLCHAWQRAVPYKNNRGGR